MKKKPIKPIKHLNECGECKKFVDVNERHTYNDCQRFKAIEENRKMCSNWYEEGFTEGQRKAKDEIIKMIDDFVNPYPEDIFPKLTDKEYKKVHEILIKELGITLDRVSANIGKVLWDNYKLYIKQKILEEKE